MSKKKSKGHASQKNLPGAQEFREISFTNLLLLGFEPLDLERKHAIPFNREMFVLPNKKGFEIVMYFLFERLNPYIARETFRDCWPICDKKQEQSFRKTISNQLVEISAEDPLANLPRIVPSLFMSPGGDRFYNLLLHFSQYVLLKVIKLENGKKEKDVLQRSKMLPPVSQFGHIILQTIHAASLRHRKRFLERCQSMILLKMDWKLLANELIKEHRSLSNQLSDIELDITDCQATSYDLAQARGSPLTMRRRSGKITSGEQQMHTIKRTQSVQKVCELWNAIDRFHIANVSEKEVVISILLAAENRYQLDVGDINVQLPEMLLRECQEEIQRHNVGNTYERGKLSLVSLIHLWNLSLHLYLEKIYKAPLTGFENMSSDVVTQIHTHHAHLSNTSVMRSTLTKELLPMLKESVHRLGKQVTEWKTPSRKEPHRSPHVNSLGLELLPPTPPVSFEPASGSQNETLTCQPPAGFQCTNMSKDTPDAVSVLNDTINKAALRDIGLQKGTPVRSLGELRQQSHGHSKLPSKGSFPHTDTNPKRERLKSAHPKVLPATGTRSTHHFSQRQGVKECDLVLPVGNNRQHSVVNRDIDDSPVTDITQSRNMLENHSKKHQEEGRKQHRPLEKQVRSLSPKSKKPADVLVPMLGSPVVEPEADLILSPFQLMKAPIKVNQILAEQIADEVTQVNISPNFGDSLIHSQESSPVDFASSNPMTIIGEEAFMTKDKLKRSPEESLHDRSTLFEPIHERILLTPSELDANPSDKTDQIQSKPFHANSFVLNDSNIYNWENVLYKERHSHQGSVENHSGKADMALETQKDYSALLKKQPGYVANLEQTLAEIFQTRTPQLSIRSKTRTAGQKHSSFGMVVETSEPSLLPHRDTDPMEGLTVTPDLNLIKKEIVEKIDRSWEYPYYFKDAGLMAGSPKKLQFSNHVDTCKYSNKDLFNGDQHHGEIQLKDNSNVGEVAEQTELLEAKLMCSSLDSRNVESQGNDSETFISDKYLMHSPAHCNVGGNLSISPLGKQSLSDCNSKSEHSVNSSTVINELLVPISPEASFTRNLDLAFCKSLPNSSNIINDKHNPNLIVLTNGSDSFKEFVQNQTDELHGLSSRSSVIENSSHLCFSGIKKSKPTPKHESILMPMSLDLSDGEDSILLPPSPVVSDKGNIST